MVHLKSVGIDIGSTTSHVVLSSLTLSPQRHILASRYQVVARETIHQSPIYLTPYRDHETIDVLALREIVDGSFASAGVGVEEIDTGVVITTGEAAKKTNAAAIADMFAESSGRFVCAAAGPELEARVGAYGSGAIRRSMLRPDPLLNVDIGGGTAKLTLVENGLIKTIGVVSVGARLVAFDPEDRRITRLEGRGKKLLELFGASLNVGGYLSPQLQERLTQVLVQALVSALTGVDDPVLADLWVVRPPHRDSFVGCRKVILSGGVSEYAFGRETGYFGDLGYGLALAAKEQLEERGFLVEAGDEGIRSTVLGVSQFTVQVSGQSIYLGQGVELPLRNLSVVRVSAKEEDDFRMLEGEVAALKRFVAGGCAIAVDWELPPTFHNLSALAEAIAANVSEGETLVVLLNADLARSLGNHLAPRLPDHPLVVLDGVGVEEFDLVDIGKQLEAADAVPVTVKSLVFRG